MTNIIISDNTPRVPYTVSSAQSAFDVPFAFFDDTDLKVLKTVGTVVTPLLLGTDFTVVGAGQSVGGVVHLAVAVSNCQITIVREVPVERTSDFPETGPFNTPALNDDLDRLIAICQQIRDTAQRAIRLAEDDPYVGLVLPPPTVRANKAIIFDAAGGVGISDEDFNTIIQRAEQAVTDAQLLLGEIEADIAAVTSLLEQAQQVDLLPPADPGTEGRPVISDGDGTFSLGSLPAARDLTDVAPADFAAAATAAGIVTSASGNPLLTMDLFGGSV